MTQAIADQRTREARLEWTRIKERGNQASASLPVVDHRSNWSSNTRVLEKKILDKGQREAGPERKWLLENIRLIRTARKETLDLARTLRKHPVVEVDGEYQPRPYALADSYLDAVGSRFTEETLSAFLEGFQQTATLEMGEIWAIKPALQYALLERLADGPRETWSRFITGLRRIGEAQWKDLFEAASVVDSVLAEDPVNGFRTMDFESRDLYRKVIADLAKHSQYSERAVAEKALEMAADVRRRYDSNVPALRRRMHVGYYLLDKGLALLKGSIEYRPPVRQRLRDLIDSAPTMFYLSGVELMTFVIVALLLSPLPSITPILAGLILLLLPATQAAVDFMNNLVTFLAPPRPLPKLDFRDGIPDNCATLVAVPTLLLNEAQVRDLVQDLEIRYLANRDSNLYFALLSDSPDSDQPVDERDELVHVVSAAVEDLNRRYGHEEHQPFYLFHRNRMFNESEGRWMGWERKRGKLLDLNQYMRGGRDVFPVKVGNLEALQSMKYVITLDSDTQLPRDSAKMLIGTIAHPLNQAVVDPHLKIVNEGYGILQPRIGVSIHSASRSRLANLYSGQTGFDIYTRAVSDVYQDLFQEGIFTGKGIYDVDALNEVLHQRFPENALLSHDLIEGAYARAGLASDIELIDDYPSHFSAYCRRKHRWVRGDWQILRWLAQQVINTYGRKEPNPISLISRWKILDNLRRSLFEPATLVLLLAGWFYLPGDPLFWTVASLAMFLMPVYSNLLFSLLRAPLRSPRGLLIWARETLRTVVEGHIIAILNYVFLLHQALLAIDAIGRSVLRVFVTKRRLLEWETAAESDQARRKSTVDTYLEWTPVLALLISALLYLSRPEAVRVAAPTLAAWFFARWITAWLNRPPRTSNRKFQGEDLERLRDSAERMWRFFSDWSSPATNWLIPDNVQEDGVMAPRVSPTNVGLLLNARIAAVRLGLLSLTDFVCQTKCTIASLQLLPKFRGHLYNWYNLDNYSPLEPRFVSTVDSGNFAACLWTLKQAALSFRSEVQPTAEETTDLSTELNEIANWCDRTVAEMDFSFLYQPRKKLLSVGFDVTAGRLEPSCYDLLASESRAACFVAIAKGDIPQESWFHLDRRQTVSSGERVLISWTGTMFEYLMPALWMRQYPDTIMLQSMKAAVRIQREYARKKGVPWGISESACLSETGEDYGYHAFGVPDLCLKRGDTQKLVVSPYATFLALDLDPRAAMDNLRNMEEFGWVGRYGFYEAVDYSHAGGSVIRLWMAHHQGMSLLAIANTLLNQPVQKFFHAEPLVLATELLLNERVPLSATVDLEEALPPVSLHTAKATG